MVRLRASVVTLALAACSAYDRGRWTDHFGGGATKQTAAQFVCL